MNEGQLSERESNLHKGIEIVRMIEENFGQISEALEDIDNEIILANIEGEREFISKLVISTVESYHSSQTYSPISTIEETRELLEQALNDSNIFKKVDVYMTMRLEPILSMAKGLLNYAQNRENPNFNKYDQIISFALRPYSIMEVRGSITRLSRSNPNKGISIEMPGTKAPKSIFTDNNFFISNREQREVLEGKRMDQPRVYCTEEQDEFLISPEIHTTTPIELKTLLDGKFFDEFLALGLQKRITISLL